MQRFRCFVAVDVAPPIQRSLAAAQARLRQAGGNVRWVEPQLLHFTLHFLGELEAAAVTKADQALARALAGVRAFPLAVRGLGAFPNVQRARVIWAGCGQGAESLAALAQRVRTALTAAGLPAAEQPFTAHVTLGRVRPGGHTTALGRALAPGKDETFGRQRVEAVLLMQSRLTPRGPVYAQQQRYELDLP